MADKQSIVFLAVNASFSHTNLAAWYLRESAEQAGWRWHTLEITVNDALHPVLIEIARLNPVVLAASFYIFNRQFLLALLSRFKALQPDSIVLAGGPEFLGDNRVFLAAHPEISAAIRGEGERALAQFLRLADTPGQWKDIPGFCGFVNGEYVDRGLAQAPTALADLPSPYAKNLATFNKPFVPLETSRGCASRCAFCVSGISGGTRVLPLERVRRDLALIRSSGARRVWVFDRTFNEKPARCIALLRLFREEFDGLRFHLEIDPARLTPAVLAELAAFPRGRLHLDTGIQSLNPEVLKNIRRRSTAPRALKGLTELCRLRNLDVHVDLIAGLPGATLDGLLTDLNVLVRLDPQEIQLEILKLLPGTPLAGECARWGIIAAPEPPYEILQTAAMNAAALESARALSRLVDWFYNAAELQATAAAATRKLPGFWADLVRVAADWFRLSSAPSVENRFKLLNDYFRDRDVSLTHTLQYAWLKYGFSARNGICRAEVWKRRRPPTAELIEGQAPECISRAFLAELDAPYLFVYGRERRAAAIYRLPASPGCRVGVAGCGLKRK